MPEEFRQVRPSSIDCLGSFFAARLIGPGMGAARKCICMDNPCGPVGLTNVF